MSKITQAKKEKRERGVYFGVKNRKELAEFFHSDAPRHEDILFAYCVDNWEGDAFALFERNGLLYEVNASWCSMTSLEGQWEPEETTVNSLKFIMEDGYRFDGMPILAQEALLEILVSYAAPARIERPN